MDEANPPCPAEKTPPGTLTRQGVPGTPVQGGQTPTPVWLFCRDEGTPVHQAQHKLCWDLISRYADTQILGLGVII